MRGVYSIDCYYIGISKIIYERPRLDARAIDARAKSRVVPSLARARRATDARAPHDGSRAGAF